MGVLADKVLIDVDGSGVQWNDPLSAAAALRIHETVLAKIRNGTGEVALAVTKLRRELGDRVAALDGRQSFKFNTA